MKFFASLLFLLISTAAHALPTEVTAEYRLSNNGLTIGRVNETFVRRGDTYTIQSVTRSDGVLKMIYDDQITLESSGRIVASGLQPLEFGQRRARDSSRDIKAVFEIADDIVLLYGGKVVEQGPKEQLKNSSNQFTSQFLQGAVAGPLGMD